ncbi:MAG: hypothetical protein K2X47_11215, partial [Bdellovibrionales bacterium]|nr:hypothetical protein [Bdellovibrionales bacterium]
MSLFRARGPARIKAYLLRWIFLFVFVAGGLGHLTSASAQMFGGFGAGFGVMAGMGIGGGGCVIPMQCYGAPPMIMGGPGGTLGMLGGAFAGFQNTFCPQKMYASGVGFGPGGTPWYTEGCPQVPMMNFGMGGCMYPYYCGGMPFPQPRQTVVRTRSCTKMVCERTPGGGLGPSPSETPTVIVDPTPEPPVKPPRPFVPPPAPVKVERTPYEFPEPPAIEIPPPPLPNFPSTPIVGGPPPKPEPPTPVPAPPAKQEGSLRSVDPSRRCLDRRQAYLDSIGPKKTEALSCPDPDGELCKGKTNSILPSLVSTFGIEESAASGAQDVLAQIYQDCRVLEIDNIICAGGTSVKNKKGELVQISGVTVTRLPGKDGKPGEVLQRTVNGSLNHEYHSEICGDPKTAARSDHCKLVCTDPALFNWAGKPKLIVGKDGGVTLDLDDAGSESKNQIVVNGRAIKSKRGHDCSGAVAAFLLADGRLFKPIKQGLRNLKETDRTVGFGGDQAVHMGSDVLVDAGDKGDTCFETVKLEKD